MPPRLTIVSLLPIHLMLFSLMTKTPALRKKLCLFDHAMTVFITELIGNWFPPEEVDSAVQAECVPVVVAGTGGIGKTSLRNILCKRIMERIKDELIIVGNRSSIIFQNGGESLYYHAQFECTNDHTVSVRCSQEESANGRFVVEIPHRVYYLVDAPQGDISKASAFERLAKDKVAFFASPGGSLVNALRKTEKAATLYMPVWEYDELCNASAALGLYITVPMINDRYKLLGGVARHVLETCPRAYERHIKQRVSAEIAGMSIPCSVGAISNFANLGTAVSHIAVHIAVGRKADGTCDYEVGTNMWTSKQIVIMVAERLAETIRRDIEAENNIFQNRYSTTLSGYVYELYAVQLLKLGRLSTLRIKTMKAMESKGAVSNVTRRLRCALGVPAGPRFLDRFDQNRAQGPATRVRFVHDDEMDIALADAQDGDIIIPTNFMHPAVDCVLVFPSRDGSVLLYLFVQATLASKRRHCDGTDAVARLQAMIEVCGGVDRCALAFFVPPRGFERFGRQNTPDVGITQVRMTIGPSTI